VQIECRCGQQISFEDKACCNCGQPTSVWRQHERYVHIHTGDVKTISTADLVFCLLFGPLYFMSLKMWKPMAIMTTTFVCFFISASYNIMFPLVSATYFAINWIGYPAMTMRLKRRHYVDSGYEVKY